MYSIVRVLDTLGTGNIKKSDFVREFNNYYEYVNGSKGKTEN